MDNKIPAFQIVDIQDDVIHAVARFEYKGFEISVSSVSHHPEICIYRNNEYVSGFGCKDATAENFKKAMEYIDSL